MYLLSAYSDGNITLAEALSVSIKGIIVVMLILALLAVIVMLLSKVIQLFLGKEKNAKSPKPAKADSPTVAAPESSNEAQGELKLYKTDEKTAAVIMAIVSKESKIPLNRLKFNSIKLIDEQEDAR